MSAVPLAVASIPTGGGDAVSNETSFLPRALTTAMQAGLASHVWSVEYLVEAALAAEPCEAPSPEPLKPRPEAPRATERETSTGARLCVIDGGKAPQKQTTADDDLDGAQRGAETRGTREAPPDTPEEGG